MLIPIDKLLLIYFSNAWVLLHHEIHEGSDNDCLMQAMPQHLAKSLAQSGYSGNKSLRHMEIHQGVMYPMEPELSPETPSPGYVNRKGGAIRRQGDQEAEHVIQPRERCGKGNRCLEKRGQL